MTQPLRIDSTAVDFFTDTLARVLTELGHQDGSDHLR